MRPEPQDIAVPPFPPGTRWIGPEPPPVERICAAGPLLVHFIDAAHHSSVRTLPYLAAWRERYAELGLTVLGVNSPRFEITAEPGKLAAALDLAGVEFPVAADLGYEIWHAYGCRGWPSLFLWGVGGALRWYHFGEGEYDGTEAAIRDELEVLHPGVELPETVPPLRASDAPGVLVMPPSEEVFPGGSISEPWSGEESGAPLELGYQAGGAFATADGEGSLVLALDGAQSRPIPVQAPGLYALAEHPRHERHRLALRPSPGVRVWSLSFAAGVP